MADRKNLSFISMANIIGTLLVVFGHSYTLDYDDISPVMLAIRTFIYYFHMPLFFLISGFLMSYTGSVRKKGYPNYIGSKAAQLLVPYLFLSVVFYIPKKMLSHEGISVADFLANVFAPRSNIWGHLWFLPALFFITLIVCALFLLRDKLSQGISRAFDCILLITFTVLLVIPVRLEWLAIGDICANLVYYFIGAVSVNLILENKEHLKKPYVLIPVFALSVAFAFVRYNYLLHSDIGHALLQFVICLMMIAFVFGLSEIFSSRFKAATEALSAYTYTVYLYSWPVQTVVYYLMFNVLHLPKLVACPLMFVTGIALPMLLSVLYSKMKFINNRFFDLILGIKVKKQ